MRVARSSKKKRKSVADDVLTSAALRNYKDKRMEDARNNELEC